MIKSIEIQNFLSHKKTKITFGKEVNAIVGATDSGKSAIIQAFRWVAFNRPSGDGFRSNWGGATKVIVCIDAGRIITRIKSATENKYILYSKHSDSNLVFNGFGTKVPIEIKHALNISETNLQTQESPYFLLSSITSPGDVAMHFNSMAHLHKIDIGRKNTSTWIREIETLISADEGEQKRLKGELKVYSDIHIIEDKLISIEAINAQVLFLTQSKMKLDTNISELVKIEKKIKEKSEILLLEDLVNEVIEYQSEIDKKELQRDTLKESIINLRTITSEIDKSSNLIKSEPVVNSLIKIDKDLEKASKKHEKLKVAITLLEKISTKIDAVGSELNSMQKNFDVGMGDSCILCGFKLKKKKV